MKKQNSSQESGKTEVSVAKIGLIGTIAVAAITCIGSVLIALGPDAIKHFATPTAEVQPVLVAVNTERPEAPVEPTLRVVPTAVPATSTSVPPMNTSVPPTLTQSPPTAAPKLNTSVVIEAENGEPSSGGFPVRDNTALSASNQAYWLGVFGASVKFTFYDMAAGQYELVIRYAKYTNNINYRDPGYQNLYVNDNPNPILITTFQTNEGDVLKWLDYSPIIVQFRQGTNILIIKNDVSDQVAGIDRIILRLIGQ